MTGVRAHRGDGLHLTIEAQEHAIELDLPLAGLYNAYNALAATTVCRTLGIADEHVAAGVAGFAAVFGRQEKVPVGKGSILLNLVKNPVGFNQVLQTTFGSELGVPDSGLPTLLVIAINDLFADGTDISWLWDVDFETLADHPPTILCTGLRAHDMALRLKYAEIDDEQVTVEPSIEGAVGRALEAATVGGRVIVCPTYTAMLDIRARLQQRGAVAPFWED
jgi:UDP-N-acetylmuramyl tripeptide synthase